MEAIAIAAFLAAIIRNVIGAVKDGRELLRPHRKDDRARRDHSQIDDQR